MSWRVIRLKYLAATPIVNGLGEAARLEDESWPRYIRTTDFAGPRSLREDTKATLPPELASTASVVAGDLLMSAAGTVGKTYLHTTSEAACFAGYLVRFRPGPEVDPRFISYWTETQLFLDQIEKGKVSSTIDNFSAGKYQNLKISVPPVGRQQAIADYLDTETARMDALIEKKKRMLELLEERTVSMGNELVQASHAYEVIPTLIPTLPEVPKHWRLLRNKAFMREVNRPSISGEEEMLSVSHLTGVTPRSQKTVYMFEAESTVGYKVVRPGDLVINTMWAWMGAAGTSPTLGIVSPAYGVYEIDTSVVTPDWLDMLIRTPAYITEMTRFSRGVTSSRLRLYPDEFLRLSTPVPPLDEQERLIAEFKRRAVAAQRSRATLETQVDLLTEKRQALITAAVTGELEIPGVAA